MTVKNETCKQTSNEHGEYRHACTVQLLAAGISTTAIGVKLATVCNAAVSGTAHMCLKKKS